MYELSDAADFSVMKDEFFGKLVNIFLEFVIQFYSEVNVKYLLSRKKILKIVKNKYFIGWNVAMASFEY